MPVPIILTGIHRSGTTWVGQIIAAASREPMIHEPLNRQHGMRNVPCWYPYHPGGTPLPAGAPHAERMEGMIEDLLQGRARWVRTNPKASLLHKVGRAAFGTRAEREYRAALRRGLSGKLFLKDPFCLFLSPYMVERFQAKVVITLRHPGALLVSMRRMGWSPHISSLTLQPGLVARYLPEFDVGEITDRAARDEIFANAVFWLAAYRFSSEMVRRFPENVLVLKHEELSLGSAQLLERLVTHLEIERGLPEAAEFVRQTTSGKTVVPAEGVLHNFSRDAASLTRHWQQKLTEAEQASLSALLSAELDELAEPCP